MPRCHECSKVVIPRCNPKDFSQKPLRTWPSGPELIRSADSGCDLCSFVRKEIDRTSLANYKRMYGGTTVVLRDCHQEITMKVSARTQHINVRIKNLQLSGYCSMDITRENTQCSLPETPEDLVSHACELLEHCLLNHNGDCESSNMDPITKAASLPRRLLDMSYAEDIVTIDVQAWLAAGRATIEELSNYCTLSYRWGNGPPACMLSTCFLGERVIPLASMPKTFKDAIFVARGLKIRFLWIDTLCIVQPSAYGDSTDWDAEGPRMWLVYQNAVCTIAATCSNNPNDGFLSKVGIDCNQPCSITAETDDGTVQILSYDSSKSQFYRSVVTSNLNRRGWVAQERLLSRRIVHFTEEGIFWECQEFDATSKEMIDPCEVGAEMGSQHASFLTFSQWLCFIEFYSLSEFSQKADRLIALSSIARSVSSERFGKTYFAGIWQSHLEACLSWKSESPCSADSRASCLEIAPSWSWASAPGKIEYANAAFGQQSGMTSLVRLKDTSFQPALVNDPRVERYALKLSVRLSKLCLPTDGVWDLEDTGECISGVPLAEGTLRWDEVQDNSVEWRMYNVVPLGMEKLDGYGHAQYQALVVDLLPSTGNKYKNGVYPTFRRIGYLEWTCELRTIAHEGREVYEEHDHNTLFPVSSIRTIVLV